jgi:hypothetical protein
MHFPSSHIAHETLGYISLNVEKDFGATFKRKREEKVRREGERKGQVLY